MTSGAAAVPPVPDVNGRVTVVRAGSMVVTAVSLWMGGISSGVTAGSLPHAVRHMTESIANRRDFFAIRGNFLSFRFRIVFFSYFYYITVC